MIAPGRVSQSVGLRACTGWQRALRVGACRRGSDGSQHPAPRGRLRPLRCPPLIPRRPARVPSVLLVHASCQHVQGGRRGWGRDLTFSAELATPPRRRWGPRPRPCVMRLFCFCSSTMVQTPCDVKWPDPGPMPPQPASFNSTAELDAYYALAMDWYKKVSTRNNMLPVCELNMPATLATCKFVGRAGCRARSAWRRAQRHCQQHMAPAERRARLAAPSRAPPCQAIAWRGSAERA